MDGVWAVLAVGQRRHMVMCVTSCVFFRGPPSGGLPLTMDLFRFFRTARVKCQEFLFAISYDIATSS